MTEPAAARPRSRSRLRRAVAALMLDVGVLRRRREFRLLTVSQAVSLAGSMVTFVAVPFQVYDLTGSSAAVGLLGVAELIPIVALALVGGALADAFDRRLLVRVSEAASAVVAGVLVLNAALERPQLWLLYVCVAVMAALTAIRRPPLDALVPRLVDREELKAAMAIEHVLGSSAFVIGPAIGGLLIALVGLSATYAIDVVSFLVSLAALSAMQTPPSPGEGTLPRAADVIEGVRYAMSRQVLIGSYVVDVAAMLLAFPVALFPQIADEHGGARTLGLLFAAPSLGGLLGNLFSGWSARVHRHGVAVVLGAAAWGGGILVFALVDPLWPGLVLLAVAGAGDAVSGIFRATIWNETIPDRLRGRLAGVEMISWSSGPLLGQARAGVTAGAVGVRAAIAGGGALCLLACAGLARALPEFWAYDARRDGAPEADGARAVSAV